MTDSLQQSSLVGKDSPRSSQEITEADVLITHRLASRPTRQSDLVAENNALRTLAQHLRDTPQSLLKTLVRLALDLCQADTAGVSLLETLPNGELCFRWVAIAGALEPLEQSTTPGNFSPCGTTLACNQPQLYHYPEHFFTDLYHPQFPIVEQLLIPIQANDQALGTLWIVSHHQERQFDPEDQRLMISLESFTAFALHRLQQTATTFNQESLNHSIKPLDQDRWRKNEERLSAIFSQAAVGLSEISLEGRFQWINDELCRILGRSREEMLTLGILDVTHPEDVSKTLKTFEQLVETGNPASLHKRYLYPDGMTIWANSSLIRLDDEQGCPSTILVLTVDVSERKQAELNAEFLATVTQSLVDATCVEEIIQTVGQQLNHYLKISMCAFIEINQSKDEAAIHHDWHQEGLPSLKGVYRLPEYVTGEFFQAAKAGQTIVVRNIATDSRIRDQQRFTSLKIGSFINIPLIRDNEWKFTLGVYHQTPYPWNTRQIELMRELANRIWTKLERTRVEVALRKSEEKYRSLFNSMDEGFCILQLISDHEGKPINYEYIELNPSFEHQTGLTNALGKTILDLLPDIEAFWLDTYGTVALTGKPIRFENYSQVMGQWFDVYAFRIGEPEEHKVAVLFNDISKRKQAEEELRSREVQLKEAQRLGNFGSWYWDAKTDVTTGSDQLLRIYGFDPKIDKMPNFKDQDGWLYPHESWERINLHVQQAVETGVGYQLDVQAFRNGTPIWLTTRSEVLYDSEGKIVGLRGTVQDITERKQAELERELLLEAEQQARAIAEAAQESAQTANRIKDEFLAVLSHELRSPLNPILGWSKLLQSRKLDAAKTQQALKTIERNAQLQSELIEDLLDVSRILQGKLNLNVSSINLVSIIQAAMETVRLAADAKSITIEASLKPDVGLVSGDATRLQQVIWNLLSNAVKFTPTGGTVSIRLERLDSRAQITVSDTGQGIASDFVPYVFDYFRQADATTTRKVGGLGLGLAIVRNLVELHGGTVEVESPGVGMGTTFTVRLPLIANPAMANQNSQPLEPSSDLKGIQVLVVDNELDSQEFVAFVLEQAGATVMTATTADEALAILMRSKLDILLSDIGMPDMDGYMLIQQVRALPPDQGSQIPAIAITAYTGDFNKQQALQAGFQLHLSKPIEPERLIQVISSLIKRR